ncbi:MAG: tetratricopeptide repeat protein [Parcubacteria group bacterium]|jgi:tetratricopeptide (TPR) repeat protein
MLYTIVPPILIVISLVGIIIFLVKKAPEVARLDCEDEKNKEGSVIPKKSIWSILRKKNIEEHKDFNHKTLLFLEKTTKKLKVFFLKMENMFTDWGESIRNKRKAREEEHIVRALELIEENKFSEEIKKSEAIENTKVEEKKEETESKIEKKDILEKILVERIATNPKDIEAYERLGEYYFEIENWNYAKECFKQVLKLNPRNIGIRSKMRKLERMLGK